jgi:hypothetical protein
VTQGADLEPFRRTKSETQPSQMPLGTETDVSVGVLPGLAAAERPVVDPFAERSRGAAG